MVNYVLAVHKLKKTSYLLFNVLGVLCNDFKLPHIIEGRITVHANNDKFHETDYIFIETEDFIDINNISPYMLNSIHLNKEIRLAIVGVFNHSDALSLFVSDDSENVDNYITMKEQYIHRNDIIKLSSDLGTSKVNIPDYVGRIKSLITPLDLDWSEDSCLSNSFKKPIVSQIIKYLGIT